MSDDHGLIHLVRIYGEIDRAIAANPDLAAEVSWLLPAYAEAGGAGAGWFDQFEAWTEELVRERGGDPQTTFPSLEQAIVGLAELEPKCRMRARRLHAVGAAARTLTEPPDQALAAAALGPRAFQGFGDPDAAAKEFVELLRSDPIGTRDEAAALEQWWGSVLAWDQLPAPDEVGPPPCSGGLVWVDIEGESEPVATLETVFEADISFEAAKEFCNPMRWTCFPFWCDMLDLQPHKGPLKPNGVRPYRETVSLDCDNEHTWLVVDLNFTNIEETGPRVATTEYELGAAHPYVRVNEGTLEVVELSSNPPSVRVKSTKRLKFSGTFDGPAFASVMCHVGYLSYVEDLLCCAVDKDWKKAFPGRVPREQSAQKGVADPDPYFAGLTKYTIDRVAASLEDCLDECSKDVKAPSGKAKTGSGTAATPAQHMANTYSRMLHEGARVADIGLRGARMGPGTARRSRSGTGAPGIASTGGAGARRLPVGEVIEDWTQLGKLLVRKWSAHASQIATKLDARAYDADTAAADMATTASLAIETGARLTWETLDSATILCGGPNRPYIVDSDEFSTSLDGATLALTGDLKSGFGYTLPANAVLVLPTQFGPGGTKFKLRADATGCRAGTYRGKVRASTSTPDQVDEVSVRIVVP